MNKENVSKLWKMIQEAGDYLQDQVIKATVSEKPFYDPKRS